MPKFLEERMKLNWNFHKGGMVGEMKTKNPLVGAMDIFGSNTPSKQIIPYQLQSAMIVCL